MHINTSAINAQAELHHAYLLGLQLMVATREGPAVVEEWMFRLFRRQHLDKFLASFEKLGLTELPDVVACAQYHVLSNGMGGVPVEFMPESDTKAWVRYRYPRWWLDGPAICGIPVEASRGFMRGWHAHNGVSLGNPRLGFVCVSEDMTGEFGLCGYFREFDYDLTEAERLQFARDERPPTFDASLQPSAPPEQWSETRLLKARRNYAVEFVRNGVLELGPILGAARTRELAGLAASLIGLQYYPRLAGAVGAVDGDALDAARFLSAMFEGMGDEVRLGPDPQPQVASVEQLTLRIVRDLTGDERALLLDCWAQLWRGVMRSHRSLKSLSVTPVDDGLLWQVSDDKARSA